MPIQTLEPGFRLGKYEVLSHVASGGMGAVYKAQDSELRRVVALKILDPALAAREEVLERFKREARHAARLVHKHIVTLYEAGEDQGYYYLALEFVEGIDLYEYIQRRGQLDPEETRRILIQATKALDHAYQQGIVHRDIKPANFLLAQQGSRTVLKLADMGLAHTNEEEFRVTRAGSTVGTIDYMSPEQARNSASADVRSDIYSLGCTGYHMLAGQAPFAEGGLGERVLKHLETPPPDLRAIRPDVSAGLWGILQRMLAKKQEDRYQTPAELLLDLKATPSEASEEEAIPEEELLTEPMDEPAPVEEAVPPPLPEASPAPRRRRRTTLVQQPPPTPVDGPTQAGAASPEHGRAAAGQFERARQVIAEGGNPDYARQLLSSCCKLDPSNTTYRAALRQFQQGLAKGILGRWFGSLGTLALSTRLKSARRSGDHRKVLELGEEILARQPADVATHLEMAEAAGALGLSDLAVWLLEKGCEQAPDSTALLRALALRHEEAGQLPRAIALWEQVRKADPSDFEAQRKLNALWVSDHIKKGHYPRRRR